VIRRLVVGIAVKQFHNRGQPRGFVENNLRGRKRFVAWQRKSKAADRADIGRTERLPNARCGAGRYSRKRETAKINLSCYEKTNRSREESEARSSKQERPYKNYKGRDIGYALAAASCEGAHSVDACTVTTPWCDLCFRSSEPQPLLAELSVFSAVRLPRLVALPWLITQFTSDRRFFRFANPFNRRRKLS
jgi:hypothetical protein